MHKMLKNPAFADNYSKFFDLTNKSNKSYYIDSLEAFRGSESVDDVWLRSLTNPNRLSAELRVCYVGYMYIKYLNVFSN